jgi:hypothetical protein
LIRRRGPRRYCGRRVVWLSPLLIIALLPVARAGAASARSACTPAGSKTVVTGKSSRVFRSRGGSFYGCLFARRKPVFLATGTLPLGAPRVGGPFAAFSRRAHHDGSALEEDVPATVLSIGLCRNDRRRFKYDTGAGGRVSDLVVSSRGDIAWIAHQAGAYRVFKLDATTPRRKPATVSTSATIAPRSLTLKRGRISWRDAGSRRSARLKPLLSTCRP